MRYQVPQFIEVEDKIFGPLTFRQFVYMAGGAGLAIIFFVTLPLFIAIILTVPALGAAAALAFYKINDRPLIDVIESAVSYFFKQKLYLWKMREAKKEQSAIPMAAGGREQLMDVPNVSKSKLKDIAWSLDVHESIYSEAEQSDSQT